MSPKSAIFRAAAFVLTAFAWPYSAAGAPNTLELPTPDGCYRVGTQTIVLSDGQRKRDLLVTFWYPAARGENARAPYLDKKTAAAFAKEWNLEPGFEEHISTHGSLRAAIATGGPFPIVLLEHGSGVVPAIYTVLAEGLASNGFVVIATNHTPDSLIAVFPDGHVVHSAPYWPVDAGRRAQGVAIGEFAENVLVADVRFVLGQLDEMQMRDEFWRGHLDLGHIGIVGHSMGGTTAALATKGDVRILAGVNIDGSTFPGMNADVRPIQVRKPFLFLMTEEHASDPGSRGREYVGKESDSYYVVLPGDDHMSFTDKRLLQSRFSRESQPGQSELQRTLASQLTRSLAEEFLSKYLKGQSAPYLELGVRVERK